MPSKAVELPAFVLLLCAASAAVSAYLVWQASAAKWSVQVNSDHPCLNVLCTVTNPMYILCVAVLEA